MANSKRTRLTFDSADQIRSLDHWVKALSEPGVELGDVERYTRSLIEALAPALDRYREENV